MVARVIFHIDLNAFFASAELLKNSALEGQPVAVAGLHRRSVVSTANYEARKEGVHSAMPLMMALEKCPNLVVVQGDYEWYKELSHRFFKYVKTYTSCVEPASIDECYMDVTEIIKQYKRPLDLAWKIQKGVYDTLHLPCSIGVGPNKFLAKMASDMRKPMGITVLRKHEISAKLWPLPIADMWGIGKKSVPILEKNGICTIGDLANTKNESKIITLLGKQGYLAIQHARGNGSNKLSYNTSVQSISQSTTLDNNATEYDEVKAVFKRLAHALSTRAKQNNLKGSLISISIRYYDFTNVVRQQSIQGYTNDEKILLETALLLFDQNQSEKEIRHLGIGLGSLYTEGESVLQMNMFKEPLDTDTSIHHVIDELNKQIPGAHLMSASQLVKKTTKYGE